MENLLYLLLQCDLFFKKISLDVSLLENLLMREGFISLSIKQQKNICFPNKRFFI